MTVPNGLPAILKAYGNPFDYVGREDDWERAVLVTAPLTHALPYAYREGVTVGRIRAHRLVIDELMGLLEQAVATGVPLERIAFGGVYAWRAMRASPHLSTHTWGIAIDLDPVANPMGQPHRADTGMPLAVVDVFERAGWMWGGRWTRPDPMHFQRASGY